MKIIYITIIYISILSTNLFSQVEKYCQTDELITMYPSSTNELKLKFDFNKVNSLPLTNGIGISYTISTSENITQFSANELESIFNLANGEQVDLLVNNSELKMNFNTCIRIEYIKDRLKSLGIQINELKETLINITN